MAKIHKLYEKGLQLKKQIETGNCTVDDIYEFVQIQGILSVAGDFRVKDLEYIRIPSTYNFKNELDKYKPKSEEEYKKFYDKIVAKIEDIYKDYLDENIMFGKNIGLYTADEAYKLIRDFYYSVSLKDALCMEYALSMGNIIVNRKKIFSNEYIAGQFYLDKKTPYIAVRKQAEGDLYGIDTLAAIVHEVGHMIGNKKDVDSLIVGSSPFRELIPVSLELMFCEQLRPKTIETSRYIYKTLYAIKYDLEDSKDVNSKMAFYVFASYVGLYLSHLYMNDRRKFKDLYKKIKKYIFTDEETKVFDLLNEEKELLKGDFLRKELEEVQKNY